MTHATHQGPTSHGAEAITRRAVLEGLSGLLLAGTAAGAQATGRGAVKNVFTAVSRNASATQPARPLAVLLAKKGVALTTPAQ